MNLYVDYSEKESRRKGLCEDNEGNAGCDCAIKELTILLGNQATNLTY